MTTSEKQIEANRKNGKKSNGPKTPQGKIIASKNSTRHGLYSKDIIINSPRLKENREEYDSLLESLTDELKPATAFQHCLVQKIANCLWRSRRAITAETAEINNRLDDIDPNKKYDLYLYFMSGRIESSDPDTEPDYPSFEKYLDNVVGRMSIPHITNSLNIQRYEMRLDRQMTRAYKLLKYLQMNASENTSPNLKKEEKQLDPDNQ